MAMPMTEFEVNDELLLPKLFSYNRESEKIETVNFVNFHKETFEKILFQKGILVESYNANAISDAGRASFLDVGFFYRTQYTWEKASL